MTISTCHCLWWNKTRLKCIPKNTNFNKKLFIRVLADTEYWSDTWVCIKLYVQLALYELIQLFYEWMNGAIYFSTLCIVVHPKRFTIMWGDLSSTTTSVQHPLEWCDGCHRTTAPVRSPHTCYRWRGERVIEPIKWMGIIRRPWLTRARGGNLARTPRLHSYSLREVPWDF